MKNLTSIVDHSDYLESYYSNPIQKWDLHLRRKEFGKQPLAIWMFIPCKLVDGVWVVLEEPNTENEKYRMIVGEEKENILDLHSFDCDVEEYQQAKETCIFKNNLLSLIEIKELITQCKTIEFLINYHYEKTGSYLETNKELF